MSEPQASEPGSTPQGPTGLGAPPRAERVWLHLLLFALTLGSAMIAYVLPRIPATSVGGLWSALSADPKQLLEGVPFALALMAILLAHEMGHYVTARRYGVDQSLPYFIPAPTLFGTLGAIILMRSQPRDRRVLLNVAVMGPYAGLVLAIPATAWGLAHSTPLDPATLRGPYQWLGSSLLFGALERTFSPNGANVVLHPVALAGWVGMFITSINLIPASQLDGGHVAYALFGRRHERVSLITTVGLLSVGLFLSLSAAAGASEYKGAVVWIFWALLLLLFGVRHPPVQDEGLPLTRGGRLNAWVALTLFILTFIPVPIQEIDPADRARQRLEHMEQSEPSPAEEFKL